MGNMPGRTAETRPLTPRRRRRIVEPAPPQPDPEVVQVVPVRELVLPVRELVLPARELVLPDREVALPAREVIIPDRELVIIDRGIEPVQAVADRRAERQAEVTRNAVQNHFKMNLGNVKYAISELERTGMYSDKILLILLQVEWKYAYEMKLDAVSRALKIRGSYYFTNDETVRAELRGALLTLKSWTIERKRTEGAYYPDYYGQRELDRFRERADFARFM